MTESDVIARDISSISQIRPYLSLSGIAPLKTFNLKQFTCIINCVAGLERITSMSTSSVLHIAIEDDGNIDLAPYWQIVFQKIDKHRRNGGNVLIFCGMGISRSATFVIGYLMCVEKMTLHDAYKDVQQIRNVICPNVGFFKQLIELEKKHHDKNTVKIIEPIRGIEVADVVWNELYYEMERSLKI